MSNIVLTKSGSRFFINDFSIRNLTIADVKPTSTIIRSNKLCIKIELYLNNNIDAMTPTMLESKIQSEGYILKKYQMYNCLKKMQKSNIITQVNKGKCRKSAYVLTKKIKGDMIK